MLYESTSLLTILNSDNYKSTNQSLTKLYFVILFQIRYRSQQAHLGPQDYIQIHAHYTDILNKYLKLKTFFFIGLYFMFKQAYVSPVLKYPAIQRSKSLVWWIISIYLQFSIEGSHSIEGHPEGRDLIVPASNWIGLIHQQKLHTYLIEIGR